VLGPAVYTCPGAEMMLGPPAVPYLVYNLLGWMNVLATYA
jgi:hypothetical protein